MSDAWKTAALHEVCDFSNGLWKGETPPFVTVGVIRNTNFAKDGGLDDSDIVNLEVEQRKLPKRRLQFGDIILEKSGGGPRQPVGRVALFEKTDGVFSFSNFTSALRVRDPNQLDFRFLHKFLYWTYVSGRTALIQSHSTGIRNLDTNAYKALRLGIPSLAEQKRIVALLDQAFEAIENTKANTKRNALSAEELFTSYLRSVFSQDADRRKTTSEPPIEPLEVSDRYTFPNRVDIEMQRLNAGNITKTGGRLASTRHIAGKLSLAVGLPKTAPKEGWRWSLLSALARLESGHTPSRKHPEYWGGKIPWIGIQDARENHGQRIVATLETTNESGIANSSARVLPKDTVCLSRTASVGYVVTTGRPMATSQDFVNWICSGSLVPDFLKFVFLAEGRQGLLRYASGSVHQTIYFPEAKAFCICHPDVAEQMRIVRCCDELREESKRLEGSYLRKVNELLQLKTALLNQAFNGEL
jgi:restriction endonuclease S subunit